MNEQELVAWREAGSRVLQCAPCQQLRTEFHVKKTDVLGCFADVRKTSEKHPIQKAVSSGDPIYIRVLFRDPIRIRFGSDFDPILI